ncbi:MAG TPA: DUF192 domain-containing protein [Candidatus Polarisedimenticolia bacterium]|nr:DUF192 domain-containing protein [Candidatus Polarisedimenticolia bacterium]
MVAVLLAGALASALPAAEPRGLVRLPSGRVLSVEIADTPIEREVGYMNRERIADDEGMVFLQETLGFHYFWMKNCKVSLDIVWLDETWRVVHIERNLPPCSPEPEAVCPHYTSMQASRHALEVRGGLTGVDGLKVGDVIVFSPPPATR